ncbi:MAG TPA: hypothetical protein VL463_12605 [Kofleriaceae bacterium]|nr:hypothetical protein [Kofleriaceae bacterium]
MKYLLSLSLVLAAVAAVHAEPIPDLHWRMVGPFRGGRTRAAAGVTSRPDLFYVAQVDGGVWKTEDAGRTWQPIFDGQPTQSIGSIAIAPSNPDIIYVGSGEGLHRPDLSVGDGVYRSGDAGKTWTHVGLDDAQQIPQLAVDPKDPNRVFAAVLGHPYGPSEQRGVFRSLDGGKTWTRILFKDVHTGASDVAIDPRDPKIVYAALWEARLGPWEDKNEYDGSGGGLFKSTDGGATWKQLTNGQPANTAQLDVAIAPSNPNRLYVTLSTTEHADYASGKGNGLYRSDDAGATWKSITTDERAMMKIGGGDLMVPVVDPKNPDVVYVASIVAMKSIDGGKTWTWLKGAPGGDDYQNLWINGSDPRRFVLVSDQGASVTVDGGATWSSWYNQPTAQLYHVGVSADVPYRVCSGQQESGSVCIASRGDDGAIGIRDWHPVAAIEYGYVAPDPRDPDIIYGAGRNVVSRYSRATGQVQDVTPIPVRGTYRVERTQPILFSPVDPKLLYYAANVLFSSTDGGQHWRTISPDLAHPKPGVPKSLGAMAASDKDAETQRGAIYAVAPSHKTTKTIWAGTDDGKIWRTGDGGAHWADITPPAVTAWSKVTQLDASHFDDTTVYASVSRLRVDDLAPYVYRTHDRGKTWTAITTGLPPAPVDAVREDPIRKGLLYAATENGVWVSFDDGDHWQSLQLNLPHTSVRDLVVHGDDLIVATHGRGFWILDDVTALRQVAATMPDTLFAPAVAIRTPRSTYPDTPIPPDEPMAENPPTGAILDYYLATPAKSVAIEILDDKNAVVRRYASDDPPEQTDEELAAQLIPASWAAPRRRLAITAGMHRWIWDLRRPRPLAGHYEYPINAVPHDTPRVPEGARVLPGTYTVALVVDGKRVTRALQVKIDPRVKLGRAALVAQNKLEVRLAELVTRSSEVVLQARSVAEQLAAIKNAPAGVAPQIAELQAKVSALLESKTPATVTASRTSETLSSLYKSIAVDASPTASQLDAAARAEKELVSIEQQWTALRSGDLARLNGALAAAKLAEIKPERRPVAAERDGNEE